LGGFAPYESWRLLTGGDGNATTGAIANTLDDFKNILFAVDAYQYALGVRADSVYDSLLNALEFYGNDVNLASSIAQWNISSNSGSWLPFVKNVAERTPGISSIVGVIADIGTDRFLDMLRGAVTGEVKIGETTPANFSSNANAFFAGLTAAQLQGIQAIYPSNAIELGELALTDVNARAALASMSLVAVDVSQNIADRFSLYDEQTGEGEVTKQWISDRSAALAAYSVYWRRGETDGVLSVAAGIVPFAQLGDTIISDIALGSSQNLTIDGFDFGIVDPRYVRFGDDADNNNLSGGVSDDRLYGGGGKDTLNGAGGNDYLEGGNGNDILDGGTGIDYLIGGAGDDTLKSGGGRMEGGAGNDIYIYEAGQNTVKIKDSDGLGSIQVTDGAQTITLGGTISQVSPNDATQFKDSNDNLYKKLNNGDLEITPQLGGRLIIEGFTDGQMGLTLGGVQSPQPTDASYTVKYDVSPGSVYIDYTALGLTSRFDYNLRDSGDRQQYGIYELGLWVSPNTAVGSTGTETIHLRGYAPGDPIGSIYAAITGYTDSVVYGDALQNDITLDNYQSVPYDYSSTSRPVATFSVDPLYVGNDVVYAGDSADYVQSFGGTDYIYGEGGNDWLLAGVPKDNTVTEWVRTRGYVSEQHLFGGAGADRLFSNGGDDHLDGGIGNDDLFAGAGDDLLLGGEGDDILGGDVRLSDFIIRDSLGTIFFSNVKIIAETTYYGNDTLVGGAGKDFLIGGGGLDWLEGGDGDDILIGDSQANALTHEGVTLNVDPDAIHGADYLDGGKGDDTLSGNGGDDELHGGEGVDQLIGGRGDDALYSGIGTDQFQGEQGDDVYSYQFAA
jgi:Ca2+-binding RTX toxin-like protein